MAATNPFRVSDLIKKYGWTIMPYLSNLGPQLLAEAQILFVDSGHTNALDADDTEHGHSFERPLATWDYAIGLCTAGEKSVIFLAPGHNENLGDAQITHDVNDVVTIGIGDGPNKPRIDFGNANSSIDISANNVVIRNVNVMPAVTQVLIGVHVMTGATGCKLVDVDFLMGEDGAGVDEFIKAMELTSGNHDTVFENVRILAHASATHATHGIHIAAASNRLIFKNVVIHGPYATGGIVEAATGVNHIVEDCSIDVSGTNYSFDGSSTFAKYTRNVDAGVDSEESEPLIEVTRGTGDYPTGITAESIFAYLMSSNATPNANTFNNATDSLEAISDKITAIDNTTNLNTAVPDTPTAKSLQDILSKADGGNTYDNTTDSLEAISEALEAGTGCTAAIDADSLDKLVGTSDTDQAYPASLVSHSILSSIMTSDGNPAGYDRATDSLEAIADAVAAITDNVGAAVPGDPTARSLQDILEKDTSSNFDRSTDSLEAIADRLIDANVDKLTGAADGTGNYPASVVQDSVIAMILSKSANPVATSYDNQTDSLEAISDALSAAIGSPSAGSALDILKKLHYTADGTGAFPATVADDSVLAKIMGVGNPASVSAFDNTTDSLEAISDFIRTGTTALRGINLDYLMKTAVASGADLTTEVADGSVLSNILDDGGDTSAYDRTKHSLFAIGADTDTIITNIATAQTELDKIGTVVNAGGTATIGAIFGDFANSSLVTRLGNLQTDADRWGTLVNAGGTAELGAMLGDFANSTLVSRLDTITTDTAAIDPGAKRLHTTTLTDWSLSASNALWTVSGMVRARIWGEVLVAVKAVAMNLKLSGVPTAPGGAIDICANLDCNNDAAGTIYKMATTLGGAMQEVTGGVCYDDGIEVILPAGTVVMGSGANEDGGGSIQWFIQYEPLEAGATVTST